MTAATPDLRLPSTGRVPSQRASRVVGTAGRGRVSNPLWIWCRSTVSPSLLAPSCPRLPGRGRCAQYEYLVRHLIDLRDDISATGVRA
jgi:hypothetical protein